MHLMIGLIVSVAFETTICAGIGDMDMNLPSYRDYRLGYVHGVQYWMNPGFTTESIENDFRRMSEEDNIDCARLAFWGMSVGKPIDFTLWDVCFVSASRHNIILISRYKAVGDIFRKYVPETQWRLEAPDKTVVCRRLSDGEDSIFALTNESEEKADFKLDFGYQANSIELLWVDRPGWHKASEREIVGTLGPLESTVVYCSSQIVNLTIDGRIRRCEV